MSSPSWRTVLRSAFVFILLSCDPESSLNDERVWRWMECLECRAFELDSVVALGGGVVPLLSQILDNGPPPDRRDRMQQALDSTYRRLSYAPGIATIDSAQWVDHYLASYSDTYKGRAAWALGQIGGAVARQSLETELQDSLTQSVRGQIRYVIDSVCGTRPDPAECQ
jgi:hypothetical protein